MPALAKMSNYVTVKYHVGSLRIEKPMLGFGFECSFESKVLSMINTFLISVTISVELALEKYWSSIYTHYSMRRIMSKYFRIRKIKFNFKNLFWGLSVRIKNRRKHFQYCYNLFCVNSLNVLE